MTDHIKVEESFVDALVKNAAWDAARVSLVERGEKADDEAAGNFGKPNKRRDYEKAKKAKPDDSKKAKKDDNGDKDDKEVACESVEEHVCPLCESVLEEDITDEQLAEHIALIKDAMGKLDEEDENIDEKDENIDEEDSVEKDTAFKKVMTKVAALKTANQAAK